MTSTASSLKIVCSSVMEEAILLISSFRKLAPSRFRKDLYKLHIYIYICVYIC